MATTLNLFITIVIVLLSGLLCDGPLCALSQITGPSDIESFEDLYRSLRDREDDDNGPTADNDPTADNGPTADNVSTEDNGPELGCNETCNKVKFLFNTSGLLRKGLDVDGKKPDGKVPVDAFAAPEDFFALLDTSNRRGSAMSTSFDISQLTPWAYDNLGIQLL